MKKFMTFAAIAFAAVAVSCNNSAKSTEATDSTAVDTAVVEMPAVPEDVVYEGTVPGADVATMTITLTLKGGNTFVSQAVAEGKEAIAPEEGTYTQEDDTIKLSNGRSYLLHEDRLVGLDVDKQPVESNTLVRK